MRGAGQAAVFCLSSFQCSQPPTPKPHTMRTAKPIALLLLLLALLAGSAFAYGEMGCLGRTWLLCTGGPRRQGAQMGTWEAAGSGRWAAVPPRGLLLLLPASRAAATPLPAGGLGCALGAVQGSMGGMGAVGVTKAARGAEVAGKVACMCWKPGAVHVCCCFLGPH